jgi:hypothetical protein
MDISNVARWGHNVLLIAIAVVTLIAVSVLR